MGYDSIFWLHIKKSAGTTVRTLLKPHYVIVDRDHRPANFIQSPPEHHNDILNNYRVVLGEYQFRRALFAKKFLYADRWDRMYSFAISREPTDRCVSMFYYLFWADQGWRYNLRNALRRWVNTKKLYFSTAYAFDLFLDHVEEARRGDSIFEPFGLEFTTHTATLWEDVTDLEGNILLTRIFRIGDLEKAVHIAREECGLPPNPPAERRVQLRQNKKRGLYSPSPAQVARIQRIYGRDFEIYEQSGL